MLKMKFNLKVIKMAKDPAFLFYPQDFITGTMFFTDEQIGIYIKLLCAQHQHGGLINKVTFNQIVKSHEIIKNKFVESEEGFYNERLMNEMIKRNNKSNNLSANALKRWNKQKECKSNAIASSLNMPIENENEIYINKEKVSKFKKPSLEEVRQYCAERNKGVDAERWFNYYESNGWQIGKNKMKNWKAAVHTWEKNNVQPVKSKLVL